MWRRPRGAGVPGVRTLRPKAPQGAQQTPVSPYGAREALPADSGHRAAEPRRSASRGLSCGEVVSWVPGILKGPEVIAALSAVPGPSVPPHGGTGALRPSPPPLPRRSGGGVPRPPRVYSEVLRALPPHGNSGGLTATPEQPHNRPGGLTTTLQQLRASPHPQKKPILESPRPSHTNAEGLKAPLPHTHRF